jgi:hypothetical protein
MLHVSCRITFDNSAFRRQNANDGGASVGRAVRQLSHLQLLLDELDGLVNFVSSHSDQSKELRKVVWNCTLHRRRGSSDFSSLCWQSSDSAAVMAGEAFDTRHLSHVGTGPATRFRAARQSDLSRSLRRPVRRRHSHSRVRQQSHSRGGLGGKPSAALQETTDPLLPEFQRNRRPKHPLPGHGGGVQRIHLCPVV